MAWQPTYIQPQDLRTYLRIKDNVDDLVIDFAISAASRSVDSHCGRQFGQVDTVQKRLFTPHRDRRRRGRRRRPYRIRWIVPIDDLMTETDLVVEIDETGAQISDYELRPANAGQLGQPWLEIVIDSLSNSALHGDDGEIAVTALWGWPEVPDAVKQATLLQASRIFSRRSSPFGVAGSPDLGSELRLLAKVDPDVAVVLEPFRRDWSLV